MPRPFNIGSHWPHSHPLNPAPRSRGESRNQPGQGSHPKLNAEKQKKKKVRLCRNTEAILLATRRVRFPGFGLAGTAGRHVRSDRGEEQPHASASGASSQKRACTVCNFLSLAKKGVGGGGQFFHHPCCRGAQADIQANPPMTVMRAIHTGGSIWSCS